MLLQNNYNCHNENCEVKYISKLLDCLFQLCSQSMNYFLVKTISSAILRIDNVYIFIKSCISPH